MEAHRGDIGYDVLTDGRTQMTVALPPAVHGEAVRQAQHETPCQPSSGHLRRGYQDAVNISPGPISMETKMFVLVAAGTCSLATRALAAEVGPEAR